jgi:hypothetical protein
MRSQKMIRVLVALLLVATVLATVNVAYAAHEYAPQAAYSCCSGYPPCNYWIHGCGWCCLGQISIMGGMHLYYDNNCHLTIPDTECTYPCGLSGCQ